MCSPVGPINSILGFYQTPLGITVTAFFGTARGLLYPELLGGTNNLRKYTSAYPPAVHIITRRQNDSFFRLLCKYIVTVFPQLGIFHFSSFAPRRYSTVVRYKGVSDMYKS